MQTISVHETWKASEGFSEESVQRFFNDVIAGLNSFPKKLSSKYFYDANGDAIFQEIMQLPEYYLTRSETEILQYQAADIVRTVRGYEKNFDVVELGPGDGSKSIYLLQQLMQQGVEFSYMPIDISLNVIQSLNERLPDVVPGLRVEGLHGEYFEMIRSSYEISKRPKLILFMGGNIGNFTRPEALQFCRDLHDQFHRDDLMFVGFDLKKNPSKILAAYSDASGTTKRFNLNLLARINRELGGNFKLNNFDHYASYDPVTGTCKSYLVSLTEQLVRIAGEVIFFGENEIIDMETSMKYSSDEIQKLASEAGFREVARFYDRKKWFVDALWKMDN